MTRAQKIAIAVFLGMPCLCCFGSFGYVQYVINQAGEGLEAEAAKAKGMGMPVQPADLDRTLPTSENAAPDYAKAMALTPENSPEMQALSNLMLRTSSRGTPAKPEDIAKAAAAYKLLSPAVLPIVEQAADKPHCDFRKNYQEGFRILFPEFATMKGFVKLLTYKAVEQSDRGDWQGALESIRRAQMVSRHAGESPTIIGMLVQIAGESIVHNAFRQIIRKHGTNSQFLAKALETERAFGPLPSFKHALGGELVMGRMTIRQTRSVDELRAPGEEHENNPVQNAILGNKSLQNAFDKKLLEAYNYVIPLVGDDPSDWEKAADASKKLEARIDADDSMLNLMNQIIFPVFSQAAIAIGRLQAERNITETAIRLQQTKLATGAYPKKLDFGPTSIDPFTAKPLVYKPNGLGFILYSVSQDKVDNGGNPVNKNSQRDQVFKMP